MEKNQSMWEWPTDRYAVWMSTQGVVQSADESRGHPRGRRQATALEAKALAHPLRIRMLRLTAQQAMTNKQLADRLEIDPGTALYHVRLLTEAGLMKQEPVRTGVSGALEKPYRSTGQSWWLDGPLADADPHGAFAPIQAFQDELRGAGPESVQTFDRFLLHLSAADVETLERRILAILDEYVETDGERLDQPALGGIFVLHRLPE